MRYIKITFLLLVIFLLSCSRNHSVDFLGYVEGKYIYLSSSAAGRLMQLNVRKGESVKAGQLAFTLDPQPEISDLAMAKSNLKEAQSILDNLKSGQRETILKGLEAQIAQAKSSLQFSTDMFHRNQQLRKTDAIGQAALDESRTRYQSDLQKLQQAEETLAEAKLGAREHLILAQEAKVKTAEEVVNRTQWALSQKTINIPKSGFIQDTFFRQDEFVPVGKPVVSLLPPENRILIFFVPENNLNQIKMGEMVYFKCDSCQRLDSATINYISSQAQYTPPVIYSKDSRQKLVYWVEANIDSHVVLNLHPGQIVDVMTSPSHASKIH